MHGGGRSCGKTAAIVSIAIATIVAMVGLAPRAEAAPAKPWSEKSSSLPSGQDGYYNDVTVTPNGTVWAVGYRVAFLPGAVEFRTNIQRYNGTSFEMVSAPDVEGPPAQNFLYGVAASGNKSVWAVGTAHDPTAGINKTRILHWNGTAWSSVLSPNPGNIGNELYDVATSSDGGAFAVGTTASAAFNYEPLSMHLVGGSWIAIPVTRPSNCSGNASLQKVYAVSSTLAWAVGNCAAGPNPSFVLKYDGSSWKPVVRPADIPGVTLKGFASDGSGKLYGVGGDSNGPVVMRVAPQPDKTIPSPKSVDTYWAEGTLGHDGIVMVGAGTVTGTSFAGPAVGVRVGSAGWTPKSVGPTFGYFQGVATAPDGTIWAVGSKSGKPMVLTRAA
jgi:hypothetical protein